MTPHDLQPVDGRGAGGWIAQWINGGPGPLVKEQIPQCFDGYLRILHPALDGERREASWSSVAERLGGLVHPQVQWHCLVGSQGDPTGLTGSNWDGMRPDLGELPFVKLDRLCQILSRHTKEQSCFFGLSTIHGGATSTEDTDELLEFPGREFFIFSGSLTAAGRVGVVGHPRLANAEAWTMKGVSSPSDRGQALVQNDGASLIGDGTRDVPDQMVYTAGEFLESDLGQAPNLMWPVNREWFVATEMDFDSTLVGGSQALVDELLTDKELETLVVQPDTSLAEDADKVNCRDPRSV